MRIGLVGLGYIGRYVLARLQREALPGVEVAFVYNRSPVTGLAPGLLLERLEDFAERGADLIVEMAHPDISRRFGPAFLATADYMPLSVTAFADPVLERALLDAAASSGRRILIPHGALVGTENLVESQAAWTDVTITFRKHPANIDFSESGVSGDIREATVVYDGPARGIAALFPRNVNTMVACGLATTGLDKCRAVLVADPSLDVAIAEVSARTADGRIVESRKVSPVVGVSGTDMLESQYGSILRAGGISVGPISFV